MVDVYIVPDTRKEYLHLRSGVGRGSRRNTRFGMNTVVSCPASCLDRRHVCLCPFAQNSYFSLFITANDMGRGRKEWRKEHARRWDFYFSSTFLQHHSWLLPHWWRLVAGCVLWSPLARLAPFSGAVLPLPQHHCHLRDHPSYIPLLDLHTRLHRGLGRDSQ